jgi:hypothetical protein
MSPKKVDGVIEAVHYNADGRVEQVRLYERRGAVFSDRVLLSREDLVRRIRTRKVFVAGCRKPLLGASFEIGAQIYLVGSTGKEMLVTMNAPAENDHLEGVPEF